MIIGVPKEIKNHEYRVGLTPESVEELVKDGHKVIIETLSGMGIGASDTLYLEAGASVAKNAFEVFRDAQMIVKVKEPQALERKC
jgi:alanine dehydrogenase